MQKCENSPRSYRPVRQSYGPVGLAKRQVANNSRQWQEQKKGGPVQIKLAFDKRVTGKPDQQYEYDLEKHRDIRLYGWSPKY